MNTPSLLMRTFMSTKLNQQNVCIVKPNKSSYTETFIQAHIERLPTKVKVLHGGSLSRLSRQDDQPLFSRFERRMNLVLNKVFGVTPMQFYEAMFRRYLRREKVNAVLAEYGTTAINVMQACQIEGIPLIVHFHGFDAYEHPILEQYSSAYTRMFNVASAVIAVSRDMEQQLLDLGAPREKVFYNSYGVDTSLFSRADPARALPIFLAVGWFVDKKAPHLTLLAFRKVAEACPEARLVMVGDGVLRESCKQLAKALGVAGAVEFPGPFPHTEVAFAMRNARAFVQSSVRTSYGDSEGTPVAVLEAGATGLPVLSTRHAGIKDVVIHGETGFLVSEGDVEGMAEHMIKVAKDPNLAATLGQRAREHICANFSMEKSIDRLWQIIKSTIHRKRP
jgi:glycosyltransferase involved in cell wall biosynthesis